jgi:hypothetical protein
MTGQEINRLFEQQIGQTYSGIEDIAKKDRRFRRALIDAIEDKYGKYSIDQQYEELATFIKTEEPFTPINGNEVALTAKGYAINHILSAKAKYLKEIVDMVVIDASNSTPIIIETFNATNIRRGDIIKISGIQGNVAANGEFYAIPLNKFKFALYSSPGTSNPVAGSGAYVQSFNVLFERVYYNYCQMLKADEKANSWKVATVGFPLYEYSETVVKFYPNNSTEGNPVEVSMNYVTSDIKYIDLTDSFDYLTIYPEKFIYNVINFAVRSFDLSFRDYSAAQVVQQDIQNNP